MEKRKKEGDPLRIAGRGLVGRGKVAWLLSPGRRRGEREERCRGGGVWGKAKGMQRATKPRPVRGAR